MSAPLVTLIAARAKALIVHLAARGFIPVGLATWLIQRAGLKHE